MARRPAADRPLKVAVELAGSIDSADWEQRHRRGEVVDLSPYGLHRLRDHDVEVWFRNSSDQAWRRRLDGFLLHRTQQAWGQTALPSQRAPWRPDVLLAWSERSGIPAVARERVTGRGIPVVTGIIWETDRLTRSGRRWLPRAAAVFVLSTGQLAATEELVKASRPAVQYVPFGVDTHFFSVTVTNRLDPVRPDVDQLLDRHPVVLSVGNDASRDHATLLRTISRLGTAATTASARLLLASRAPAHVPASMGLQVQNLMAGQLRSALARASVFAVATRPNLHVSGITAVLEAMSAGLPVVVSRTPGMADYVRHGETGLLVDCGDDDGMAAAVRGLLLDPAYARAMGDSAALYVRAHHDVTGMQGKIAQLMHSV